MAAATPSAAQAKGFYTTALPGSSTQAGDSSEFSWNAGVGGSYAVSGKMAIYGEYQYATFGKVSTGQDDFTDGFEVDDLSAQDVVLGIRINF